MHFEDGLLRIHAHVEPRQPAETPFTDHEYGEGDPDREIEIGNIVDAEKVEAVMKRGVLRITLPKSDAAKPRRIPVTSKS